MCDTAEVTANAFQQFMYIGSGRSQCPHVGVVLSRVLVPEFGYEVLEREGESGLRKEGREEE